MAPRPSSPRRPDSTIRSARPGAKAALAARAALAGGVLLLAALAVYSPALNGAFIWDDDAHVTAPGLRSLGGLWRIWTDPRATQQYYPLTHGAFWLEYQLWGLSPFPYHVVNVLLHVTGALLLWRVLDRLGVPGGLLAAAIFALHPVQVESVAWVSELKNTLSGTLYLAALLAYLRFDPPGAAAGPAGRDWRRWALALGLFACALLSKTVTASLPAAVLLIVWWKEGRIEWRRRVLPLVPFFALGAGLGLTTAWLERHVLGAEGEAYALTAADRVLIAGRALWFYAGKLLWPADLVFVYPRWTIDRSAWWQYLFPAAALAVVAALWGLRGRLGRGPLVAALFFAGTLVPALGFFNVYPFVYSFVADHFQYLASLGLIALASALVAAGLGRLGLWGRPAGHLACAALVLVLAVLSWRQAHVYRDVETLYRDTIARNPRGFLAYLNLGGLYRERGRYDDAIAVYRALIAVRPDYAPGYSNLGVVYASQRRYADAAAAYRQALAVKPDFAEAQYHLGLAEMAQGQAEAAIAAYRAALAARPDFLLASESLGAAYAARGQHDEAIATYRAALAVKPEASEIHYALGGAYAAQGRAAEAIGEYRAAIGLRPDYPEAYNNLGLEYRKRGQLADAAAAYRSAIAINPDFAPAYTNLGAVYGAQGKYAEAIAAWQSAARLAPDSEAGRMALANIEIARSRLAR
jgi:tetratricopeptide (TPR) repeat protein